MFKAGHVPEKLNYEDEERYVRFGCITSNDGDTLAYAKQASGSSLITVGDYCVRARHVQGKLPEKVYFDAILIAFDEEQYRRLEAANKHDTYKFEANVKFEIREFYFKMQHNAVANISNEIVQKLNPSREVFSSFEQAQFIPVFKPPYESIELDDTQMSAVYLILKSSPDLPVLIAGSFGTGKTRLLARAAFEINLKRRDSRILICAHHQSSVDTFVNYFGEMKQNNNIWAVNMIRVIPNYSSTRKRFGNYERSKHDLTLKELKNCQLVLTTFSTASSLFKKIPQNDRQGEGFFTDVLIDEGAQVREPEMVAALMLAGANTRIVIAGDHYQVNRAKKDK